MSMRLTHKEMMASQNYRCVQVLDDMDDALTTYKNEIDLLTGDNP